MVYGPQGERRAAFALESDKRLFEAALEEAVQPACVNCGQPCGPNKPWDDSCPHCHKPLGLPVEDVAERRYCPASALHDPNATPAPPCGFALDCIYGDKCPAGEVGPSVLTRAHAPAQPTPGPWFDWVEYREYNIPTPWLAGHSRSGRSRGYMSEEATGMNSAYADGSARWCNFISDEVSAIMQWPYEGSNFRFWGVPRTFEKEGYGLPEEY